jgi:hypothetical protein
MAQAAFAQDPTELIETYRRNFARSSLGTKFELLREASSYEGVALGPLYETALDFVLGNVSLIGSDTLMRDIAVLSVNMVRKTAHAPAAGKLWSLFRAYRDSSIRVPVMQTLGEIAKGQADILAEINAFVDTQINLYKSGTQPDLPVLEAAIVALGRLGDPSSYQVLFSAFVAGVNRAISERSSTAMAAIQGDYAAFLARVVRSGAASEKLAALKAGLSPNTLADEKRGELAETALSVGVALQSPSPQDQLMVTELRTLASQELTRLKWQRASPLAIRHFYDFQLQFNRGQVSKSNFLESIALVGAMGTPEAAQALSLYLQLINTETEQGKVFDEQITLAVVNNLGLLGDKNAFDYLLYIGYLQYPESVKRAARDALQKLRW